MDGLASAARFSERYTLLIDHFHNDVNSIEILPSTSLASISCGSKSQERALLSATHDIVLYV